MNEMIFGCENDDYVQYCKNCDRRNTNRCKEFRNKYDLICLVKERNMLRGGE